ncbi:MAG: hydroxyacylglutathione hydrolase [Pseudomonadota bacterium]
MPQLELVTIPCLSDNYAFLLVDAESRSAALIDAPEAAPILAELSRRGLRLADIWLTHHHADHTGAVGELATSDTRVVGAEADAQRLPPLDLAVRDGETFEFAGAEVHVMDASGHTMGHIAFYVPSVSAAFTADSLMAMGCGRLFEGDAPTMWATLSRLAALPPETLVCSGHEYTAANARFAETIDSANPALHTRIAEITAARAEGRPTVPSLLAEEIATNPFLRARAAEVKANLGMASASDTDTFAEIRKRKDAF